MRHLKNYAREAQYSLDAGLKRMRKGAKNIDIPEKERTTALKIMKEHRDAWTKNIEEATHFCAPDNAPLALNEIFNPILEGTAGYRVITTPYASSSLSFRFQTDQGDYRKVFVFIQNADDKSVLIVPFYEQRGEVVMSYLGSHLKLKEANWPTHFNMFGPNLSSEQRKEYENEVELLSSVVHAACQFLSYLELPNLYSQDDPILIPGYTPPPLSSLARMRGKKREFSHKILVIRKPRVIAKPMPGSGVSGWRMQEHERRGHTRTLRSGRVIPVKPCVAGDPALGTLIKSYEID